MSMPSTARAPEFLRLLENRLPAKTLRHVLSVTEYMSSFADGAGISLEQAETAGLLHDLCKPLQGHELLERAAEYEIEVTPLQRERPTLLHGPVAAEECHRSLGVEDMQICDAIRWHTTGHADWNPVGLALYVADFSEPLRTIPEASEARSILREKGFREAVLFVVDRKLDHVAKRYTLDPDALAFRKWVEEIWA